MAYMNKKQYENAMESLYKTLKTAENEKIKNSVYSFMGDVYYSLGNADSAFMYYEKVLEYDPYNTVVRNNYGYYLAEENKQLKKALKLSRYTIEKHPLNPTYLDSYGWILHKMGKNKKALDYLKMAKDQLEKPDEEVYYHIGVVWEALNDKEKAMEYYRIAYKASMGKNNKIRERIELLEKKLVK
jgi:Tfp pilus assembly protein PilF